jgi:hypothetical protein
MEAELSMMPAKKLSFFDACELMHGGRLYFLPQPNNASYGVSVLASALISRSAGLARSLRSLARPAMLDINA